ncbi:LOW QUALITY PROTEIN: hypothetical protein MAR_003507, partial [Mya arenaria]
PAIKGRNVTIIYKPIDLSATEEPIFYYDDTKAWTPVASPIMYNLTLDVFTTVFDTTVPNNGYLKAKYHLSDGCGYIYLRTPNPVVGKNIQIGYYPAPAVIQFPGYYCREWYNKSSPIALIPGLVTEEELPNKEFVLTIHNSNRWTTGHYTVKCTKRTYDIRHTEHVYVKVTAPPSQPILQSKKIVQECPECLVGIIGEELDYLVFCNTTGATRLSIKIGDEEGKATRDANSGDIYRISRTIREEDHMKTVTCSVSNAAVEKPLTTSAKLYKPELNVPIMREGSPANVTCVSRTARPATNLSLWFLGTYPLPVYHVKTYDTSTRTYTTTITLNKPARKDWNRKYVVCKASSPLFEEKETQWKKINCIYQPIVHLSDELIINARGTSKVTCTAKSLPLSDIVWSVNGDTQIHVCNKSQECGIHINPLNITEHRNYTCTAYFKFGTQGTSEDSSLTTDSKGISIEWIVVGLVANVQENEKEELNEDPTYAQVDKTRKTRPEREECKAKIAS